MDSLLKLLSLCCVLLVVLISSYKTLASRRSTATSGGTRALPEPSGALPLVGHLHLLRGNIVRILGSMADELGPAFILRVGLSRMMVVSSWELAKECFTTNDVALATRPRTIAGKHIGYGYSMVGYAPYGPYWRQIRKLMTTHLLSGRRLEAQKHIRLAEVDMGINGLHRAWLKNGGQKLALDMRQWFSDMSFNALTMAMGGKRYFGSSGISNEEEGRRFVHAMDEATYLMGLFLVGDALPFLRWMDIGSHQRAIKRVVRELDTVMNCWLVDHRQKRQRLGKIDDGSGDFVDALLSILEDEPIAGYETDSVIKGSVMALLLAGTDTSTVTLSWGLALLLNNRPMLKKALDEIDIHVGRDRLVQDSDIKNLVYLDAIIKETMRLYPAAPLMLPHLASEDCTVGGFHVPAGTVVIFNPWKIHRDPRKWSEPLEFQPERFLTTHADVDVRGKHFEYLPFGSGRRVCSGITYAMQMTPLVLARLLQAFHLDTPDGEAVDMTEGLGLTMPMAKPLQVVLAPRLPSHLYDD